MVAPHLDEGLKRGKWRNMLHNDPFWKDPNGYSFWDIMQKPILDAANEAIPAGKKFWFGVEGEYFAGHTHHTSIQAGSCGAYP